MTAPASRRGFLRGLTTLPLIGGGVALLGSPTAVAEPITTDLLNSYDAWLEYERRHLRWERFKTPLWDVHNPGLQSVWYDSVRKQHFDYVPVANAGGRYHLSDDPKLQAQPSTHAALVLSAVGCNWREGF